jgi:hypothetical protein
MAASRLPNGEQAILDIRKIEGYCLCRSHPRGRHKARVGFSVRRSISGTAMRLGCEMPCLKLRARARRLKRP